MNEIVRTDIQAKRPPKENFGKPVMEPPQEQSKKNYKDDP
jgi:hypothetical protein